jgi:hypothetical protein
MHTLTLEPELAAVITELQATTDEQVVDRLNRTVNEAVHRFLDELYEEKLDQEQAAFERLHPQLRQSHLGQYVAIHQGQVIDFDVDQGTLYLRVHRQYPHTVIGIFPVWETSEMAIHHSTVSYRTR